MIGLLDTHAFMWLDSNSARLSATARAFISDPANETALSVASIWEIVIKMQIGKLTLHRPLEQIIADQLANNVRLLPVTLDHVMAVRGLPTAHRDPFDRILAATTVFEGGVLLSGDVVFDQYPVTRVW